MHLENVCIREFNKLSIRLGMYSMSVCLAPTEIRAPATTLAWDVCFKVCIGVGWRKDNKGNKVTKGEVLTLRLLGVEPDGAGLGGADHLTAPVLFPTGENKAVCFPRVQLLPSQRSSLEIQLPSLLPGACRSKHQKRWYSISRSW